MKSFWKRPAKKKKKSKPKPQMQPTIQPKPRPEPWKPPEHPRPEKKPDGYSPKTSSKIPRPVKSSVRTEFIEVFRELTRSRRSFTVWEDFIIMFACAISNTVDKKHYNERENRYLDIIKKYNERERNLFPTLAALTVEALEKNPEQDFLGSVYIDLKLDDDGKKQIFTPYGICDMMSKITLGNIPKQVEEKGYLTIDDPCCGGGATLIAAINEAHRQLEKVGLNFQNHILVSGQDIDEIVTMMCYIQISLLGVAGYFKVGNTLTDPMTADDDNTNYWFTPMYCISPVWSFRRILRRLNELTEEGGAGNGELS